MLGGWLVFFSFLCGMGFEYMMRYESSRRVRVAIRVFSIGIPLFAMAMATVRNGL